jgi:O-antigen ligase
MGFAISSLRFAIGEAMADEPAKKPVTWEYDSTSPIWRNADYVGCAIVLIIFSLTAWIAFEFILIMIATMFNVQMSGRMMIVGTGAAGVLSVALTITTYRSVMRLQPMNRRAGESDDSF